MANTDLKAVQESTELLDVKAKDNKESKKTIESNFKKNLHNVNLPYILHKKQDNFFTN